ncbi:hypothetical protein VP01_27g2 [Puccinia sorghi]|uniref:Uncharacterized protein n=1 Tax=Puccinia sorghi TaxID=27349 RepID=A0A0L6V393_9BASI|nr:hypothetical protein VP01_27g2 [Puccinia sorghi]
MEGWRRRSLSPAPPSPINHFGHGKEEEAFVGLPLLYQYKVYCSRQGGQPILLQKIDDQWYFWRAWMSSSLSSSSLITSPDLFRRNVISQNRLRLKHDEKFWKILFWVSNMTKSTIIPINDEFNFYIIYWFLIIKYDQIHNYLINWFSKIHHFQNHGNACKEDQNPQKWNFVENSSPPFLKHVFFFTPHLLGPVNHRDNTLFINIMLRNLLIKITTENNIMQLNIQLIKYVLVFYNFLQYSIIIILIISCGLRIENPHFTRSQRGLKAPKTCDNNSITIHMVKHLRLIYTVALIKCSCHWINSTHPQSSTLSLSTLAYSDYSSTSLEQYYPPLVSVKEESNMKSGFTSLVQVEKSSSVFTLAYCINIANLYQNTPPTKSIKTDSITKCIPFTGPSSSFSRTTLSSRWIVPGIKSFLINLTLTNTHHLPLSDSLTIENFSTSNFPYFRSEESFQSVLFVPLTFSCSFLVVVCWSKKLIVIFSCCNFLFLSLSLLQASVVIEMIDWECTKVWRLKIIPPVGETPGKSHRGLQDHNTYILLNASIVPHTSPAP